MKQRLSPADRWLASLAALAISTTLVLAAATSAGHHPLPSRSLCASQLLFGKACPGCGLTRSFIALGGGELHRAMAFNPLGPVLFGSICLLLLSRIAKLATGPRAAWRKFDMMLALVTVAAMVLRTITYYVS